MHRAGSMMGEFRHVNGNIFRSSERATRDGGTVTISSDITEIKQAEARLMDAIESIRDGFALFDAEDRLITNNSAFGKSIGLPSELLRSGITFEDLVRDMVDTGVVPGVQGREEAWIADRLRRHLDPSDAAEVYG